MKTIQAGKYQHYKGNFCVRVNGEEVPRFKWVSSQS